VPELQKIISELVGVAGNYLPARRAARVNPVTTVLGRDEFADCQLMRSRIMRSRFDYDRLAHERAEIRLGKQAADLGYHLTPVPETTRSSVVLQELAELQGASGRQVDGERQCVTLRE
jgi:hypothetical protein